MTFEVQHQQQQQQKQLQQQVHVVGSTFNSAAPPVTLDLLIHHSDLSSLPVELQESHPLPLGWQRFLNLKSGEIYYKKERQQEPGYRGRIMSRHGKSPKLDLKLNLSQPRVYNHNNNNSPRVGSSPNSSGNSSPTSPPSSCVSSENSTEETLRYSNSPEATSMVLVGCPMCLMYVMLSEEDPKCPKCKSTVLLDFLHDNITKKTRKNN